MSDYNINQLKELAKKAIELDLPILKTPDDTHEIRRSRSSVIIDSKLIEFPSIHSPDLKQWSDNLKQLALITQADIFVYLFSTADWSPKRLKSYKSERGYRLFQSNHIHSMMCHDLLHNHIYVSARCIRETSQSADPYRTWCLLNNDGSCVSAGCDCTG